MTFETDVDSIIIIKCFKKIENHLHYIVLLYSQTSFILHWPYQLLYWNLSEKSSICFFATESLSNLGKRM